MSQVAIESILQTGTHLFAEHGADNVSLAQVAAKAKVSPGLIIYHFKSKDNLLFIISRNTLYMLYRALEQGLDEASTPEEAFEALLENFFTFADANRDSILLLAKFDPFLRLDLSSFPNAEIHTLKEQIYKQITKCLLKVDDSSPYSGIAASTFCTMVWAIMLGLCHVYTPTMDSSILREELRQMLICRLQASKR